MIDPRISLTPAPTINVGQRFAQSLQNVQRMQRMPFENQLLELQTELAQAQQPAQLMEAERAASPQTQAAMTQQQFNDFDVLTARALKPALDAGDAMATISALTKQRQLAIDSKLPQSEIAEIEQAIQIAQTPEGLQGLKQLTDNVLRVSGDLGQQTSVSQREREQALSVLERDPEQKTLAGKEAAIFLGISPKAGTVTGTERIATTSGLSEKVAESEANITGSKEEAKLIKQLKLEPEIARAVDKAKFAIKDEADQFVKNRSNQGALRVYEVGIRNLAESLGQTSTGPIVSLFTSLTDNARTADGAIAIMLPTLKQMYRSAGEGTFTDKDQELLEAMLPTRKDDAPTIKSKLTMLDAAVRAKLGVQDESTAQPVQGTQQAVDLSSMTLEQLMEEKERLGGQ